MNSRISEEALEQYLALVEEKFESNFSEGETYDFTRCVRPDGSVYGTRGKCRKGSEAGPGDKGKAEREAKADARSAKRMGNYDGSRTQRIQSLVGKAQKTIDKLQSSIAKAKDGPYKQRVQAKIAKLRQTQKKLQDEKARLKKMNPPQGEGFGNVSESMRGARD